MDLVRYLRDLTDTTVVLVCIFVSFLCACANGYDGMRIHVQIIYLAKISDCETRLADGIRPRNEQLPERLPHRYDWRKGLCGYLALHSVSSDFQLTLNRS